MLETITRNLEGVRERSTAHWIRRVLLTMGDNQSSVALNTAGIVISAGGATTAKTGAADFYAVANGTFVKIAAGTTLTALTGINFTAAQFTVACWFIDNAGVVSVLGGTPGATLGAVVSPQFPYKKALVGMAIITYASAFTGGTTPLDTATTVYLSPVGSLDPTMLP
jgi:hypothetical protein